MKIVRKAQNNPQQQGGQGGPQLSPEQQQAIQLIKTKFPALRALFVNKAQREALLAALTEFSSDPQRATMVIRSLDLIDPNQLNAALQ